MTTVVVLAEPPREGTVLQELTPTPLSEAEAVTLYRAMLADVCGAIQHGEADLLVNYPTEAQGYEEDAEAQLQECLSAELPDSDTIRYEPQVGQTYAGRVGNALTHLLESEDKRMVAVAEPTAVLLGREQIGSAAMKLRSHEVVLGPSDRGQLYFAGFTERIDFTDVYTHPAVETVTQRALAADLSVDYLPPSPRVERPADLATVAAIVSARAAAGRNVPERTRQALEEIGVEHETGLDS